MSQSFKRLGVILCAFVGLAVSSLACNDSANSVAAAAVKLSPAQAKQQAMSDAAYYNSIVVVFNKDVGEGDRYALCEGTRRIMGLDAGETRRAEVTTQEALNLSLCVRNAETGNYSFVQDISGVNPGDYLEWDGAGFGLTRYTP